MSRIRVNELAREVEVKPSVVLDYLREIGITDKKSHSSPLEDEVAQKVREHFQSASEEQVAKDARAPGPLKRSGATRPGACSMRRSLAEIQAEARKAVAAPPASTRLKPEMESQIAKEDNLSWWRDLAEDTRSGARKGSAIVQGGRPDSNRRKH